MPNRIKMPNQVAEAMARLRKRDFSGSLPGDDVDDLRTLLEYAEGREIAVASAFHAGYRAGVGDVRRHRE